MTDQELSDHKRRVASVYNLASWGYDRSPLRFFRLVASRLVDLADVQRGQRVLDVATGTGAAALAAARRVGPAGRVTGVDIAAEMLAQARRNVAAADLSNVDLHEADAEALPFQDRTFDAVICASSIFFLPEMQAGPREWTRVVKLGGRVAFSAFGATAFQPQSDLFEVRIRLYGATLPPQRRPFGWQRLTDPGQCGMLLEGAGLREVQVTTEQLGYYFATAGEWWEFAWGSGFRGPLSQLAPPDLERFKAEHLSEVAALATDRGIWFDVAAIFATGRVPPA